MQVWHALVNALAAQGEDIFAQEFDAHIDALMTLTMHPIGVSRHPIPMDSSLFIRPSGQTFSLPSTGTRKSSPANGMEPPRKRRKSDKKEKEAQKSQAAHNIDTPMMQGDVDLVGAETMVRSRIFAAQALGKAMAAWSPATRADTFNPRILPHFTSSHSSTQLTAAMASEEYARAAGKKDGLAQALAAGLRGLIEADRPPCYGDLTSYLHIVRAQCQSLLNTFRDLAHVSQGKLPLMAAVVQGDENAGQNAFSVADAEKIVENDFDRLKKALTPAQRVASLKQLLDSQQDARKAIEEAKTVKEQRDIRIRAAAASAIVALDEIPKRQALTIRAMMDSVKTEENFELQKRSAAGIAGLIARMAASGKRVVIDKVVGNLVKYYCTETAETPEFASNAAMGVGILSLKKDEDIRDHPDPARFEKEAKEARMMRRGAKEALEQLVLDFGGELFDKVPVLRSLIENPIRTAFATDDLPANITDPQETLGQDSIDGLSTLRALVPKFHSDLYPFVLDLLPLIAKALQSKFGVLRYAAAKCFATISSVLTVQGITMLVDKVLPSISNALDARARQGAIECIYHLIHVMEDGILPYVVFLIVPVLGRMSDSDNDIRLIATTTFATLVKLVPLEAGIPDPPGFYKAGIVSANSSLKCWIRRRLRISQFLSRSKQNCATINRRASTG